MLIKNIFGGSGDNNKKPKVAAKDCGICQTAFAIGKDDFRINHCVACIEAGHVLNADYWRAHFMQKQANALTPDMESLFTKLADQREAKLLLEGPTVSRGRSNDVEYGPRSKTQIVAEQKKWAASLETVRAQVMEHLPTVIAELGLAGKVDIELVADMIVPVKISTPLMDTMTARAVLRDVVLEEVGRLNVEAGMNEGVQTRSKTAASKTTSDPLAQGSVSRINASSNMSRQIRKKADGGFAPAQPQAPGVDPNAQGLGGDPSMDPMADLTEGMPMGSQPGLGEQSEGNPLGAPLADPQEVVGEVVRLDDSADQSPLDPGANPLAPQGPMDTMMGNIMPNSPDAMGGDDMAPADPQAPGMDGSIQRVQQAASSRVRALKPQLAKVAKADGLSLMSIAGRVAQNVLVQPVQLNSKARAILDNTPAANSMVAAYNDGTRTTWAYHMTDNGAIFTSASSEFYAKSPQHFADFISSDSSFQKWAFMPEELLTQEDPMQTDPAAMQLPGEAPAMGGGVGDLSVNEIEPTVLGPSENNQVQPGLMNDQDQIFHNENPGGVAGPMDDVVGDALASESAEFLPGVEDMLPGAAPEDHLDLAIACATVYLDQMYRYAAGQPWEKDVANNESHESYVNRLKQDPQMAGIFSQYRNHVLNGDNNGHVMDLGDFIKSKMAPGAADVAHPHGDRVHSSEGQAPIDTLGVGGTTPLDVAVGDAVKSQVPEVSGFEQHEAPTGQMVDVPAEKLRNQKYQDTYAKTNIPAAPPVKPVNPEYKALSDKDPLPELSPEELSAHDVVAKPPAPAKPKPFPKQERPGMVPSGQSPLGNVASVVAEIREVTAGMSEADFYSVGLPALVAAGYSDDEIMAYASDTPVWSNNAACEEDGPKFEEPTEYAKRGLHALEGK